MSISLSEVMLGDTKTVGALHVLSICVKLASQTLKHVRGRFYGWSILELVENRLIQNNAIFRVCGVRVRRGQTLGV